MTMNAIYSSSFLMTGKLSFAKGVFCLRAMFPGATKARHF
ncbi:hypothetical protein CSC12_5150 [Klebsiella michiganensis]|nr:hypothetical protein CSC12_5150 [Klebsiella michiganensis]